MKGLRLFVPLFVILAFAVVVGCGGGSSDGVSIPTNSQVKISTVKEMSETGISANKEFSAKTKSAEITIPANSINSNYDISINKIETANLDSASLLLQILNIIVILFIQLLLLQKIQLM